MSTGREGGREPTSREALTKVIPLGPAGTVAESWECRLGMGASK